MISYHFIEIFQYSWCYKKNVSILSDKRIIDFLSMPWIYIYLKIRAMKSVIIF